MSVANNIEKSDGQNPVSEKTGGQHSESEKSKSEGRYFTVDKVGVYSLLVGGITFAVTVMGILISLLFSIISLNNATRAEIRAEFQSLRAEIRAGFTSIDNRVVSND